MPTLFDPHELGHRLILKNRVVMAPMTRTRTADGDVPNALMATYYGQRAGAGLIVTEATDVASHSKGYVRTPGIYTDAQVEGWRSVTREVHRNGGVIFLQIWHVGRLAHTSLMPNGEAPCGVTDERASESDVYVAHDARGRLVFERASPPRPIETDEIPGLLDDFTLAFRNAKRAGFDGVEIHAANGYLFEQFMNSSLNTRTDGYGGATPQTRTRLLLEVVDAAGREMGTDRVGVRLSPYGRYGSMPADPHVEETLLYLCNALSRREVAYLHLVYQLQPRGNAQDSEFNETHLSDDLVRKVREAFQGSLIWTGGFTGNTAQTALETGWVDLIGFGRPFIANPDLVARFQNGWPLAEATGPPCTREMARRVTRTFRISIPVPRSTRRVGRMEDSESVLGRFLAKQVTQLPPHRLPSLGQPAPKEWAPRGWHVFRLRHQGKKGLRRVPVPRRPPETRPVSSGTVAALTSPVGRRRATVRHHRGAACSGHSRRQEVHHEDRNTQSVGRRGYSDQVRYRDVSGNGSSAGGSRDGIGGDPRFLRWVGDSERRYRSAGGECPECPALEGMKRIGIVRPPALWNAPYESLASGAARPLPFGRQSQQRHGSDRPFWARSKSVQRTSQPTNFWDRSAHRVRSARRRELGTATSPPSFCRGFHPLESSPAHTSGSRKSC